MTWVSVLTRLRDLGDDVTDVIKKHNSTNTKQAQLLSQKATAVRNLLDNIPKDTLSKIYDHTQQFGWDQCAFSDDSLSSKKILPNFVFRTGGTSPKWLSRGKVTPESISIMADHCINKFMSTPAPLRKKITRSGLEDAAEEAAFVMSMAWEAQALVPVSDKLVKEMWLDPYVNGDPTAVLEVQCKLADKKADLGPRDIRQLAQMSNP